MSKPLSSIDAMVFSDLMAARLAIDASKDPRCPPFSREELNAMSIGVCGLLKYIAMARGDAFACAIAEEIKCLDDLRGIA